MFAPALLRSLPFLPSSYNIWLPCENLFFIAPHQCHCISKYMLYMGIQNDLNINIVCARVYTKIDPCIRMPYHAILCKSVRIYHTRAFFVTKLHLRHSHPPCCTLKTPSLLWKFSACRKRHSRKGSFPYEWTNERTERTKDTNHHARNTPHNTHKMRGKKCSERRTLKNAPSHSWFERDDKKRDEKKNIRAARTQIHMYTEERKIQAHTYPMKYSTAQRMDVKQ